MSFEALKRLQKLTLKNLDEGTGSKYEYCYGTPEEEEFFSIQDLIILRSFWRWLKFFVPHKIKEYMYQALISGIKPMRFTSFNVLMRHSTRIS